VTRAALAAVGLAAALGLAGCSSDRPKPTPLETFAPRLEARPLWSAKLGPIGFPLAVAARGGRFFVADGAGTVVAVQADSGTELWRGDAGAPLTAGVGSDGRFAAVVTRNNEVVAFEGGKVLWRQRVSSRVVTAPLVAGERVFVLAVDRSVNAFDAADGRLLWRLQRPGDSLTLAQAGVLGAFANQLLVGQGARLAAVDPARGSVVWEVPLATPRGSNEVERLADLVGPPVRVGERLCARAFQSAVGCVDVSRGTSLWSRNVGGIQSVGGDDGRVYGADASDRITAWNAASGDIVWTHERLLNRGLSGAVAAGPGVVFGDAEGFVHFLAGSSGETLQRLPTDGSAVVGTPVVAGGILLVTTRAGGLFAFRPG